MPYIFALSYADIESLKRGRETGSRELFKEILSPTSCLHCLLPPPRYDAVLARLRNHHKCQLMEEPKILVFLSILS